MWERQHNCHRWGKRDWHTHTHGTHTHTHTSFTLHYHPFPPFLLLEKRVHTRSDSTWTCWTPPFPSVSLCIPGHATHTQRTLYEVFVWAYVNRPPRLRCWANGPRAVMTSLTVPHRRRACGGRRNHCLSLFIVHVNMSKLSVKWISWWRLFVFMNYMWRVWVVSEWRGIIMESIWSTLVLTHDIYRSTEWS